METTIKLDQHTVASPVYFFSDLKRFFSGTWYVVFFNSVFLLTSSPPRRLFNAPSQQLAWQTDCLTYVLKKLVLEVFLVAFQRKRMMTVISTEKQLKVLKVRRIFVNFFMF